MRPILIVVALAVILPVGCGSDTSTPSSPSSGAIQTTSTSTSTSMNGGTSPSTGSPIPESAAIDAITKDLTKPGAADLVAKCNMFATAFLANSVSGGNESAVLDALNALAAVVRPIDPAVADALAGHAGAAAAWCRSTGMTNI